MISLGLPEQMEHNRIEGFLLFLRWFRPALFVFGTMFALLGPQIGLRALGWAGAVILVYGLSLLGAEWLCEHEREQLAVDLASGGMLLASILIVPLVPQLFPTLATVPFIAVGIALPYRSGAAQVRYVIVCCLISVANLSVGEILSSIAGPHTPLMVGLAISSFAAAAFFVTFLLWQIGRRLSASLARTLAANAALREARAMELRALEQQRWESLGVLAGGVAHDFNNLLTSILGNAALARMDMPEGGSCEQALGEIERASRRAAELTHQLLAYTGNGQLHLSDLDMNRVAREAVTLVGAVPGWRTPSLQLAAAPLEAHGDEVLLRQVLYSLLLNAREATGEAGAIWLSTAELDKLPPPLAVAHRFFEAEPARLICLEVQDSGTGMEPATLERAFEPFFSTKFIGRGLGLAAALGIVRSHGGALEAESTPGVGSRFRLLLPGGRTSRA